MTRSTSSPLESGCGDPANQRSTSNEPAKLELDSALEVKLEPDAALEVKLELGAELDAAEDSDLLAVASGSLTPIQTSPPM